MKISSDLPEEGTQKFPGGELRYARDCRTKKIYLDEVIASEIQSLHAETMSDQLLWIGIDLKNGTSIHLNVFSCNGKAHIDYRADIFVSDAQKSRESLLEQSVDCLGLPVRVLNVLEHMGIMTLGDLVKKKPSDLARQRNFGQRSMADLVDALAERGLKLEGP